MTRIRQSNNVLSRAIQTIRKRNGLSNHAKAPWLILLLCFLLATLASLRAEDLAIKSFQQGIAALQAGDPKQASEMFRESVIAQPSSGALHNLGNAEWQVGHPGPAVLAWEDALWIDPRNTNARASLQFARRTGNLDEPDLRWYEVCSSWLPYDWWPWMAMASFWGSLALLVLPPVFRSVRREWYQAGAAACAAVFLLCLPAIAGLHTRTRLGFILPKEAPLRVTPTAEAQILTFLPSGQPARLQRTRGNYALIRTRSSTGWVQRNELGLLSSSPR